MKQKSHSERSNRTFMELKCTTRDTRQKRHITVLIVPLWNWNKWTTSWSSRMSSSNRTFMELKYNRWCQNCKEEIVLIVPLWNWNSFRENLGSSPAIVLIVPLWNWNPTRETISSNVCCSNRTFMELKWHSFCLFVHRRIVLIVPLWNWNKADGVHRSCNRPVLIVPLWNWNWWDTFKGRTLFSF